MADNRPSAPFPEEGDAETTKKEDPGVDELLVDRPYRARAANEDNLYEDVSAVTSRDSHSRCRGNHGKLKTPHICFF